MEKEIDNATDSIANAAYDNKFFKAVKYICNPETKQKIIVHNKNGKILTDPEKQYQTVKEHFQKKLFDPNKKSVERFVGEPKPLNK